MAPRYGSFAACAVAALALLPVSLWAQVEADMNASNNPLTPSIGFNLQNNYTGRYYGLGDEDANAFLMRGTVPHKLFGGPQLLRYTLPAVTTPHLDGQRHTDVGDLNLFNLFLFKTGGVELGVGPQLTVPTAGRDETGTGKWQAGFAAAAIVPQTWGLAGSLLTWQKSFAGDSDREDLNSMQVQPFIIYNLPQGWYLRSTAAWNFDLKSGGQYIPLGLGAGSVRKHSGVTYNLFAEPQWTVSHEGDGVPKFQVFLGLNMQFPL